MKEPNIYAKRINEFMKRKRDRMQHPMYYIEADENYILKIGLKRAKAIWIHLETLSSRGDLFHLSNDEGPFCILRDKDFYNCMSCHYGKIHGICESEDEDNEYNEISSSKKDRLTSNWYSRIIDEINKLFPLE